MNKQSKDSPVQSESDNQEWGGRSAISVKGNKGPIKTILIGNRSVEAALFQATGDPVPRKDSSLAGKSRTSDPKSELDIN
jgi:hypothetical protein